jgi:hypothetical protein
MTMISKNILLVILIIFSPAVLATKKAKPIPTGQFDELHGMFKTQPGESRFWGLPWMIQMDDALRKGAAEGKPVFVWCGAGGAPVGVC